jgi:inhibitor of KinA sporulation pathway (predicted exonuclease)
VSNQIPNSAQKKSLLNLPCASKDIIFVALDLENNQPSGSIIQIGAVAGNASTGQIIAKYCTNVQLPERETLLPRITELTGITPADCAAGIPIGTAYVGLCEFIKLVKPSTHQPLVWGVGDMPTLKYQIPPHILMSSPWPFGHRWIDVKAVFQTVCISHKKQFPKGGLAKSLLKLGLRFQGTPHSATDDAENTFLIYAELLNLIRTGVVND